MNTDLSATLLDARATLTQHSANLAVIRKHHEMDMAVVQLLDAVVRPPPPPGQGLRVDKTA